MTVTDTSNAEWYAVKTSGGSTGYIYSKYLQLAASGSSASGTTTEYVHLRSGPGTSYSSKGVIASGTKLTITDTSNSTWYAVKLANGTTGYMYAQYVKLDGTAAEATAKPSATAAPTQAPSGSSVSGTTTEYVHLRSGPGTSYSSKGVIASGTQVTVTDRSNSTWYAVKTASGTTGYIYSIYLKILSDNTATTTPKPTATPTPAPSGTVQAKTTAGVNLRRGAGTGYGIIKVVPENTTVTVTDTSNSQWYKVKLSDGTEG